MSHADLFVPATLSAKKGDAQDIVLAIHTAVEFPTIAGSWGHEWQGLGTADPSSYRNADGVRLPQAWTVRVLHRDPRTDNPPRDYSINADLVAGHGVPNRITFRGAALPEVTASVRIVRDSNGPRPVVYWAGNGLTTSARAWLADQLDAVITRAIADNGPALAAAAIAYLREAFAEGVRRLREDADKREAEAADILAILEARKGAA